MAALLASRHLAAVDGFTPVVLHEPGHDPAPGIERLLDSYGAARAPHFKDVNDQIAAQVRSGRLTYTEAVGSGMYRPLGRGDVDFAAIVSHLRGRDYGGWYVLEQDTILTEEPRGESPVADVRHSAAYLRELLTAGR